MILDDGSAHRRVERNKFAVDFPFCPGEKSKERKVEDPAGQALKQVEKKNKGSKKKANLI